MKHNTKNYSGKFVNTAERKEIQTAHWSGKILFGSGSHGKEKRDHNP